VAGHSTGSTLVHRSGGRLAEDRRSMGVRIWDGLEGL
jgi:hypothetical protein